MRVEAVRKHVLVWSMTGVLLAGAWVVSKATLPEDAGIEPFVTTVQVGDEGRVRNLVATVTDVRLADRVSDASGWSAEGTWLVVDLEAAAAGTQDFHSFSLAQLAIGERTFGATERGTSFLTQSLVSGVPRSGSLAFELPAGATVEAATLRLGVPSGSVGEVLADGVIEVPIDLSALSPVAEVVLDENGWARR